MPALILAMLSNDNLWLPRPAPPLSCTNDYRAMNKDDNAGREQELQERIANLMRANEQARKKPITIQERQTLKAAASRLDQLLNAGTNADRQSLQSAAARLDQLLADIRKGKDVTTRIMRRPKRQKSEK